MGRLFWKPGVAQQKALGSISKRHSGVDLKWFQLWWPRGPHMLILGVEQYQWVKCVTLHLNVYHCTLCWGGGHYCTCYGSMIYLPCDQKTCLQRVLCNRFHNNSSSSAVMLLWKLAKEVTSVALCNLNHMRAVKWFMRIKHLDDWLEVKAFLLDFPKQLEFKIYFTCSLVSTTLWTPHCLTHPLVFCGIDFLRLLQPFTQIFILILTIFNKLKSLSHLETFMWKCQSTCGPCCDCSDRLGLLTWLIGLFGFMLSVTNND